MRKIILLCCVVLYAAVTHAQVSGTKTIGTDYPTLAAAITALNTSGVGAGGAIINVPAAYTETAPTGGFILGSTALNASLSSANTLSIKKSGTGANPILTAWAGTGTADGIFNLAGVDYTTIDGIDLKESATNTTATLAMERGYFLGSLNAAAPFDGCQNNTIQNCTITLNRAVATYSYGIYAAHNVANASTALTITAASDANSNNKIYSNKITNCIVGIEFLGYAAASPYLLYDQGNDIGGTTSATGNTITNFGTTYAGIYGIASVYQNGFNASYNTISNMADGGAVTNGTLIGIDLFGVNSTFTTNGNVITLSEQPTSTSYFIYGISCENGTSFTANNNNVATTLVSGSTSTSIQNGGILNSATIASISGNTVSLTNGNNGPSSNIFNSGTFSVSITNNTCSYAVTSASTGTTYTIYSGAAITGDLTIQNNTLTATSAVNLTNTYIGIYSGGVVTGNENIVNNKFGPTTYATSGTMYLIYAWNNSNNKIITGNVTQGAISKTFAGNTFYGYLNQGVPTAAGTATITGNNFSNVTLTGATTFYGINNFTASALQATTVSNNTVSNITGGTSSSVGIYLGDGNAASVASNNTVTNMAGGSTVYGLYLNGSNNVGTATGNTITGLSSSGAASPVFGVYVAASSALNITKNKISNLTANGATGVANGIAIAAGTLSNVYNNFIFDLKAPSANNATSSVNGINVSSTSSFSGINVYYNTININASSSGAVFSTAGILHTANATATTAKLTLIDNIINNTSTANGATGFTAAYRRSNTNVGNYSPTSNNNLFYAGTPSANSLIYYDGTNALQTLAAYKSFIVTADAASISVLPNFVSATDLHLSTASNCSIDGKGAPITSYTTDFDGDTRNASTPDIGADEFTNNFTLVVTNPAAVCAPATVNITAPAVTTGSTTGTTITYWADAAATTPIPAASGTPAAITVSGTYYIQSVGTGGCSSIQPVVVTINPVPVITPTFTQPTTCVSTDGAISIVITGGGSGTYSYSWTGPGVNPTSQNQTGLVAGDYTVTVTDIGNPTSCATTASYTLVGPGGCAVCPSIGSVTTNPTSSTCIGSTVTLTASGLTSMGNTYGIIFKSFTSVPADPYTGGTVLATVPNGSLTSSGTVATATTNFATANTYYIYAILTPNPVAVSCRPSNSATFVINPTPTAVATPANQTVCSAATITSIVMSGTVTGTTYNWTRNNTASVTGIAASGSGNITGALTNTTNAAVTVTFTITPTANGCGGTPITATVIVNPTANAVATPASQTICSNTAITAIALSGNVTGTSYAWTRDNTATVTGIAASGSGNISGTLVNTGATAVTVTFTITPSFGGCNGTPITATVLVNPTPDVTQPSNQTVCNNSGTSAVNFTSAVTGTTFSWTNNTTSIGLAASGTGNIPSFTGTNTTAAPVVATITVTPSANGCPGAAKTFTITVNPTTVITAVANQTLCPSSSTTAITFASTVTGTTYSWTNNTTSIGLAASGNGNIAAFTAVNTTNAAVTATITVTPTANGCPGAPITFTITVNAGSTAATGATTTVATSCGPTTVTLAVQGGSLGTGASWKWYSASCGGTLVGTGATLTGVAVNATTTFYVRAEGGTCGNTSCASVTVTINPIPTITLTAAPYTSLRPPLTTTITANITPAGSNTIVWYKNGNVITGATTNTLTNLTVDQLGTYTVGVTTPAGCSALSSPIVIKDSSSDRLFISPNPNNGQFKIRYYSNSLNFGFLRIVNIYDSKGERVMSNPMKVTGPYSSLDVDIRNLAKGLYIIVLSDNLGNPIAQGKVLTQ